MSLQERNRRREEERKRQLELSRYTHNLSRRILTGEGKSTPSENIPDRVIGSFQRGSILDRDAYWQEHAKDKNYGQQMLEWIGTEGKPGMAQWVKEQTDADVIHILEAVGLKGTHESIREKLQGDTVKKLLATINSDLAKKGEQSLQPDNLSDDEVASLIFYSDYLNPTEKGNHSPSANLINALVKSATVDGNSQETIARLQKVAPLLRVAGEEGQQVLAALAVAKIHGLNESDSLNQVKDDAQLNEDETVVWGFLHKNREILTPNPMEKGRPYNIVEELTKLEPEAAPGHPFWVEEIPTDFVAKLTPDQLKLLERRKSLVVGQGQSAKFNPDLFPAEYEAFVQENIRVKNAAELSSSGLFSLTADSAPTPEKQAELYRTIGEIVLRIHQENPKLLEEFLQAQTPEAQELLTLIEYNHAEPYLHDKFLQLNAQLQTEFEAKFNKKYNPQQASSEEKQFWDQRASVLSKQLQTFQVDVYKNFSQFPERNISVMQEEPSSDAVDQTPLKINVPETVKIWPERVKALQEVLQQDPLILTPEQIRQIEFLSSSIDAFAIIKMMQGVDITTATSPSTAVEQPMPAPTEAGQSQALPSQQERASEETAQEAEQLRAPGPIALSEFFPIYRDIDKITPRNPDLTVANPQEMSFFPSGNLNRKIFEIGAGKDGQLEIYLKGKEKDAQLSLNLQDPFLGALLKDGSLSLTAFNSLMRQEFGQSTILAYVLNAASDPSQQETLFKNLFFQVAKIYKENMIRGNNIRSQINTYFKGVKTNESDIHAAQRQRLFGSDNGTIKRLNELEAKIQEGEPLSKEDFQDISLYALPFNLQTIAQQMQSRYKYTHAG